MNREWIPWVVALLVVIAGAIVWSYRVVAEVQVAYVVASVVVVVLSAWYGISPWSRFGPPKRKE